MFCESGEVSLMVFRISPVVFVLFGWKCLKLLILLYDL